MNIDDFDLFDAELNPVAKTDMKEGIKYDILQMTDVQFHSDNKRPTEHQGKKIAKAIEKSKPVRTYHQNTDLTVTGDNSFTTSSNMLGFLYNDAYFIEYVKKAEVNGRTFLLAIPKSGVSLMLGEDAAEYISGKKGKRKSRFANKNKDDV